MADTELRGLIPGASEALSKILDSSRGSIEPPIRSEIFGPARFAQHGQSLAETHRADAETSVSAAFFPRLRVNIQALREAYRYIGLQAATGYDISPAAEWLLDNFHLIEGQLKEIHDGLPRSYFRKLPVLQDEPLAGLPRIYGVAWAFVAHTDGAFDEELLVHYLGAYQQTRDLNLSEIWALPTTLRVVLIENLRRLAERVAANKAAREVANRCADELEQQTVQSLETVLALLNRRGVGRVFLVQMAQRLQDQQTLASAPLEDWLQIKLPNLAEARAQQAADQAADNLSVSNAVTSLRTIGDADWLEIVASTNSLMRIMLTSAQFAAEHTTTRDQALHEIEKLAKRSGRSEVAVAKTLLSLMQSRHAARDAGPHSSASQAMASAYWLQGDGRAALVHKLGLDEQSAAWWRAAKRRLALPVYLGSLLLGTCGLVAWILHPHRNSLMAEHGATWLTFVAAILMILPASEVVVALINRLISESLRPKYLPRLALVNGIPAEHRVLLVIPALLTDERSIDELVERLLLHYLANIEPHAQFALLTDWGDADSEHIASDRALLEFARHRIRDLNVRYSRASVADNESRQPLARSSDLPIFILLHRARRFSPTEQRWIGWERKRGKLEQLIAALSDKTKLPFIDLDNESRVAPDVQYIITLDSDTVLPPGTLRELVSVAAHPDNQPRLDAAGHSVVAGYGILQPRVATPLPAPSEFTLYHWLFSGQCGIDPYSAATSEIYQDLFDEGSFTGKGLLNVRAMHAVLSERLPEGQVLSHDLLEGALARCAAITDITVIEDAPFHADVAASRVHRWTRGDWQLLPLLLRPVRYPLRAINRWKMFDNLRRSLVVPASLALVVAALAGAEISPGSALALIFAAFSAGPVMGAVAGFAPSRDDVAKLRFFRQAATDLARALVGALWQMSQLLQQALMAVDAISRALYRMLFSHRNLLQWTTAAAAQANATTQLAGLAKQHWRAPLVALLLVVAMSVSNAPHLLMTLILGLVWGATALSIWWVSRRQRARVDTALRFDEREYLESVARDSWRLFERSVGPTDSHLPPDNLQMEPQEMVAHRTSPTNIGLYLLSVACARQFGWINTDQLLQRMEATCATLLTMQRHRGHFLNWYDTQTATPLLPMYVSTVDSGNLSGHLLAAAQACIELSSTVPDLSAAPDVAVATRLKALAQNFERIAWEADFRFLYHRKRHLFHIGYRVAELQLDAGFYDLLASESRLTSLLAIAKGDVPVRHWSSLGRPFYVIGTDVGLRSWSGSMFEYLMPSLVLDEPHGSVLREASRAAVREQIAFAREKKVPWGISESAYAGRDDSLAYQYAPQGVPRLALRRTPRDELVIAPYATALAALVAPHRARQNFAALETLGARAHYGFIEALDFTAARQSGDEACTPVVTFMAHHQAMSIVALANVLLDDVAKRWGMANASIKSVSSLLHERAPREISNLSASYFGPAGETLRRLVPRLLREVTPGATALQPTHVLSNGRYSVTLRANGAGYSRWGENGVTRWRDDGLRDCSGSFFYLRHAASTAGSESSLRPGIASLTQHPAPDPAADYQSTYHADRMCFDTTWPELQTHLTVWVSPEDDIEFREVTVVNLTDDALDLELISAFEVTLADPRADESHPAFSNMFVRAECLPQYQALVFQRTPRLATEQRLHAAHFLANSEAEIVSVHVQTDRCRWLGRNRDASQPLAAFDEPLSQSTSPASDAASALEPGRVLDTGLDPVAALAVRLRIAANGKAKLTFASAATDSGATLLAIIDKYRQASHVKRASLMSATLMGIRLRGLGISPENFAAVQSLTTALVLALSRQRSKVDQGSRGDAISADVCDRKLLWRFSISGDRPIILVTTGGVEGLGMLRSLAQGLRLWSWGGVSCDLVVLNGEPVSYQMALQRGACALRDRHNAETGAQSGHTATAMHVLRTDELSRDEVTTLKILARVRFNADGRPLAHHVDEWSARHHQAFEARKAVPRSSVGTRFVLRDAAPVAAQVAKGQFAPISGEFRFDVNTDLRPQRPWINVMANAAFGAQLSEAGGGYSWAVNSRLNQLTAWSNDPLSDPASEWFLLQDVRTRQVWSLAPSTSGLTGTTYRVSHGQGYSVISHLRGEVEVAASWCVDPNTSVKQVRVRLINRGHRTQHLRVVAVAEWLLGANRSDRSTVYTNLHSQDIARSKTDDANMPPDTGLPRKLRALLATQRDRSAGFGDGTAFLALTHAGDEIIDWTCDRRECFDVRGQAVLPDEFAQGSGVSLDPCAALSTRVSVNAGETVERVFWLGYADSPDAARQLAAQAATTPAVVRMERVRDHWDQLLGTTSVKTPDPLFDVLVNRWLIYQTVSCRLWAKAGFYQAGGATGFRDQLQDSMALAWAAPDLLRQQIVTCASRQFPEGDVQHWWHAPTGAGVRTHFSDDLLWLPHAILHYLRATGDSGLLDETVPFLEGAAITDGAEDAYYMPTVSSVSASVYEHAARTLDRSLKVGVHGLPLMGSGDWNDGMNRVGHEGRGESVWLGWFLCQIVVGFSPIARSRDDDARAERWETAAQGWRAALKGAAWDGAWFKRAFFDNGQALGSHVNAEAKIDLIAQAWSVLSGEAAVELQRQALTAVENHLVDHDAALLRLLDPPLEHAEPSAGYIQAYPPGVRENGGQYSHGGVWALMAQARMHAQTHAETEAGDATATTPAMSSGDGGDAAYRYFTYLSPAHRAQHPAYGKAYAIEPYVVAGDVYTQPPYVGRGGWSWYTGAAAWLHRAAIESIFGLQQEARTLRFTPCLPSHWNEAELTLVRDGRSMRFILLRLHLDDAANAATQRQAQLLLPGASLAWNDLSATSCFLIPLSVSTEK